MSIFGRLILTFIDINHMILKNRLICFNPLRPTRKLRVVGQKLIPGFILFSHNRIFAEYLIPTSFHSKVMIDENFDKNH